MLTEIEAFLIMVGVVDFLDRPSDFIINFYYLILIINLLIGFEKK